MFFEIVISSAVERSENANLEGVVGFAVYMDDSPKVIGPLIQQCHIGPQNFEEYSQTRRNQKAIDMIRDLHNVLTKVENGQISVAEEIKVVSDYSTACVGYCPLNQGMLFIAFSSYQGRIDDDIQVAMGIMQDLMQYMNSMKNAYEVAVVQVSDLGPKQSSPKRWSKGTRLN